MSFALVSAYAPDFLAGVRKAIERGLPAEAALRAITLAAAEVLGVADRLGSLEAGKIANVVVWSGEPLAKDAKAKMVFVDGVLYEPDEKPKPSRRRAPRRRPQPVSRRGGSAMNAACSPLLALASETIAIRGGTILTVGPQGTIENGTVLIRDGQHRRGGHGRRRPRGRARHRRHRPLRHARPHRRPLAHRGRRRRQRVHERR